MRAFYRRLPQFWVWTVSDVGTDQNLSYDIAGGKGKFMQRNLLAPDEIIAKKTHYPISFPIKKVLPNIHGQQMLHSTIHKAITKPFLSLRVFVDEKLKFGDEEM